MTPERAYEEALRLYHPIKRPAPGEIFDMVDDMTTRYVLGDHSLTPAELTAIVTGETASLGREYDRMKRLIGDKAVASMFPALRDRLVQMERAYTESLTVIKSPEDRTHRLSIYKRDLGTMHDLFTVQMGQLHHVSCRADSGRFTLFEAGGTRPVFQIEPTGEYVYDPVTDSALIKSVVFPLQLSRYLQTSTLASLIADSAACMGHVTTVIRSETNRNRDYILSETVFPDAAGERKAYKFGPPVMGDALSPRGAFCITLPFTGDVLPKDITGWYIPQAALGFIAENGLFLPITD